MTAKRLWLAFLAFFLTSSSSIFASDVGYLDLSVNRNTNRQFIIDSTLQNSVSSGVGYSQTINNCGFNGLQSLSFDVPEFDVTKSYLVEMKWTIYSNSEYAQNATQPVWFNRANTPNPNTPYAFTTTTIQTQVTDYTAPNLYHTSFNFTLYAMVTPSGNGSTTRRMQIGDYVTAFNSTYLMNYPAFETSCYVPNNTSLSYRVSSIGYLEVDDSVTASVPLLLNQLLSSESDPVDLTTIENLLTSININITDLPTFITTVETDLSTILTDLQAGNASAADAASRLSTVISVLQTIAGNQISSSDLSNLATSSDVSSQTSAITTLLNTIISNQGSSGGGGSSVDLTTIETSLTNIVSYLSSISSNVSSTATNVYGIAQNANTQTGYQYDIANNTDYIPLIYNYLTGSSGGGSTGAYDQDISTNTQSTATNTQSINSTLNNSLYDTDNDTALQSAYSQLETDYQFDVLFGADSQHGADFGFTTGGLKNIYNFIVNNFFGGLVSFSESQWSYFLGNNINSTSPDISNYNNSGATKMDGSRIEGVSLMPYKCKPLYIPLPEFVVSWLNPSSLSGINSPSTYTTNFVIQKPAYAFGPFGSGPGFLLPCFYDIFPEFFESGWGHYWMVASCFFILGWMFIDFFDFLSGCLTLQNANTLKKVKKMF